jgi:AraC-like DNA-binding protein
MSERTLRRRLAEEGTSLRALVDEVRATLAAEFLRSGSLTVAEIAHRLGYVEQSSFSQAFKRWHGVSPRAYAARSAG